MRSLAALPASLLALLTTSLAAAADDSAAAAGLQIDYTTPVTCSRPSRNGDNIAVHYKGTLQSTGVEFDESYRRGAPFTFTLGAGRVIQGWDLGLLDMCPGERRNLTIPPALGYGNANMGAIPPGSTLLFETELVDIEGVKQETLTFAPTSAPATATEEGAFGIATAPPTPPATEEEQDKDTLIATPLDADDDPNTAPATTTEPAEDQAECRLLGPFALLVQAALGGVAILSLVWKRYRETPKRPWKIFFFDVSKQVVGSMLTHVLNLAMSMFSTNMDVLAAVAKAGLEDAKNDPEGRMPNPCSYYLLNLGIDTTIGIPVLYILLKILHALFLASRLITPPESIKSGHYGHPPRYTWWIKQSLIYFIGLFGMKLFVFFLFSAMPWLPWIGDWALRWTNGNEALEVTFAMFIFPLGMNAIQYWIIDSFIMEKNGGGEEGDKGGYEQVLSHDDEDEERDFDGQGQGQGHGSGGVMEAGGEDAAVKGKAQVEAEPLAEVNPTPVPAGSGK
ncbi:hypothetical protein LTR36_008704 [Oleoguttula mirabilis]|uniref:peptidylprolyl isomerase n=1 Tax=Oleoguttula mirabilis TaxID=1507867 RepID=A0AAV9JV57_9PEZI|nr:hypothetical protein LTR36_008704 [Oleoguttula mirabilis]